MKATEQTQQMLDRAIRKIADKFPASQEAEQLTDIHIRITQIGFVIHIYPRYVQGPQIL